ncbi:hypothetical protein I0C86_14285 [Plantactinospora sp. S1510]|uniref:Uncharacterized protein n=1 Tax=Plantactinospora alkalitolerans TaxID=2789879 RepID=A0ABS0GV86_9ACTN|nr:hypothetical protein [Plantactinospora alkalitolerans]MBF9130116.1 hypothetical protein [Plantactinospora alkalitolerans]
MSEKLTAGIAGAAVAAGGIGLIASTATGPAFFATAVGWITACAGYGVALGNLALCLETNGYAEMAQFLREKSNSIMQEIEAFREFARSVGFSM